MLSILRGSLNALVNLAAVKPYTELITIFSAKAKSLAELLSVRYLANFPPSIFLANSKSPCLIASLASKSSLNLFVYLPNKFSATMLLGCMDAISNKNTFEYIPGSEYTYPPSPITSPL